MHRIRIVLAAAISLSLVACLACKAAQPPSVILVSVDTLRADHLGCYGYSRPTSPNIDAFAREALLFENAIAHASSTLPTVASILTGFLPHETKIIQANRLLGGVDTLAEKLRANGYSTLAVVSNFVLRAKYGFAQGFDVYDEKMDSREQVRPVAERIAENTTDRAIELLDAHQGGPLFLWVHYQDPHATYSPPERFVGPFADSEREPRPLVANETLSGRGGIPQHQVLGSRRDYHDYVDRYDGEIRYLDEHFGRLLEVIERRAAFEDALIVFTADHGESMGEHGYFFTHGENLHHGVTHVPLIMKRGTRWIGRRTDYVQHVDIVPTILETVGLIAEAKLRGRNLVQQPTVPKPIYAELWASREETGRFVIRDGLKLVHRPSMNRFDLYDLSKDPREEVDLVDDASYRESVEELSDLLVDIRTEDRLGLGRSPRPAEPTPEERARLRALGYGD